MNKLCMKKNETIDQYNRRVSKLYYSNGYHIIEISKKLNIDIAEVYNYVAKGNRITTKLEREAMINLYNKGYSYSEIARIFNRSRACVTDRIKSPTKIFNKKYINVTDDVIKKITDMVKNGATIEEISKETGLSVSNIKYRLSHTNMKKKYNHVSKSEEETFLSLYNKGYSYYKIGKLCNRSDTTVMRHLHKVKIDDE